MKTALENMAKVENTTIFIGWWRTYGIDDKPAQRSRAATVHRLAGSEQQTMIGAGSHKLNRLTGIVTTEERWFAGCKTQHDDSNP